MPQPSEYKDPRIVLDREKAKMVGEIICKEIENSLNHEDNKKRYNLAKRCEQQTNQITKWMAEGKTCDTPWKNASDYFIPLTEWTVDAVCARVLQVLFSQEPYMTARGVEASDVPNEDGVTDFVDMALREIVRLYENARFFFKQMIKLPFAVAKYDWTCEFDSMIVKSKAKTFINPQTGDTQRILPDDPNLQVNLAQLIANGYQEGPDEDVWVKEDKELVNAPQFRYIPFADYVYSPYAKRGQRLYWEGDKFWLTLNEMMLKVQQEKMIKDSVEVIKKTLQYTGSSAEQVIKQRAEFRECFHWYGRFPFNKNNEIDFTDPEAIEQEVYCVVDYKEKELLDIMRWPYRRIPWPDRVYLRGEFEETENFEGRSLVEKLYMTQKEMNDFHNTLMNNAWIAMQKIFVKKRSLQGDEWEKPEVYPGVIWEEDMTGDIRVLEVGDVKQIGLEIEGLFINYAERISNISLYQTGTAREVGQKTKGEVLATISEGNIGMDKFIQNCHGILRKVCQWTVDYYYDRMPPGLERRIRGETGDMIFPTQDNMPIYAKKGVNPYWQTDDMAGKFDFTWQGTSLNSSKEWKITLANDLQERYLPQPMVQGNLLAVWEILKRGLEARGIKNWNTILPPKEAIIKEMAKMAEQAKVQKVRRVVDERKMESARGLV